MVRKALEDKAVEIEVTRKPEEVGRALMIHVAHNKKDMPDVKHYVPISTVHEIHDGFIVMDKWMADQKGLRY